MSKAFGLKWAVVMAGAMLLVFAAACAAEKEIVEVVKEVVVEKVVVQQVPVEKIVEREVIKEVPVEVVVIKEVPVERIVTQVVTKEVIRTVEVPVEKIVEKEVVKIVEIEKPVIVERVVTREVEVVKEVEKVVRGTPTPWEARQTTKATDGRYGGTFKTVSQASIATIDPLSSSTWVAWAVAIQIYDSLFASDGLFQIQPQMVEDWSISSDGLVWTFKNREGLLFHDGSPVTAEDVEATFERAYKSFNNGWKELDKRSIINVVDNRTWTLTFREPFGLTFDAMNFNTEGFPVQKASVIKDRPAGRTEAILQTHIGSGPYKFVLWDVGNRVLLERFEGYLPRSEAPSGHAGAKYGFVDRIEFLEIPDVQTRLSLLETKGVDFIDTAPLDLFEVMQANRNINIYTDPIGRWPMIYLNHRRIPFSDVKARQAIQAAVDNSAIMAAYGPPAIRGQCSAIFLCGLRWDSRVGEENYNQNDIPKAKRLLSESKYDGRKVVALTPVDQPTIHPILTVSESNIRAAGFNLDMNYVDWATLKTRRAKPDDWDIFTSWGASAMASPLTNNLGLGGLSGFKSERISDLREAFFKSTSVEDQKRLVDEMQMAWYEEVPYIRLGFFSAIHASGVWVRGFDSRALWPAYWNVWLDR